MGKPRARNLPVSSNRHTFILCVHIAESCLFCTHVSVGTANLIHKPILFKSHYFESLGALAVAEQIACLLQVLQGNQSIIDMVKLTKEARTMNNLHK